MSNHHIQIILCVHIQIKTSYYLHVKYDKREHLVFDLVIHLCALVEHVRFSCTTTQGKTEGSDEYTFFSVSP